MTTENDLLFESAVVGFYGDYDEPKGVLAENVIVSALGVSGRVTDGPDVGKRFYLPLTRVRLIMDKA